jgi:hypothetical protein
MQVSAVSQLFAADAAGAVQALAEVVQQGVVLPGARMNDGWHRQGHPTQLPRISSSSSSMQGATQPMQDQQQQQQPEQQADSAGITVNGSIADARCCSQLYVDFMAAADELGIWTVNDVAAAVEQCCKVWQVRHAADDLLAVGTRQAAGMAGHHLLSVDGCSARSSIPRHDKARRQVLLSTCCRWISLLLMSMPLFSHLLVTCRFSVHQRTPVTAAAVPQYGSC